MHFCFLLIFTLSFAVIYPPSRSQNVSFSPPFHRQSFPTLKFSHHSSKFLTFSLTTTDRPSCTFSRKQILSAFHLCSTRVTIRNKVIPMNLYLRLTAGPDFPIPFSSRPPLSIQIVATLACQSPRRNS
jgi:hypothetical protein